MVVNLAASTYANVAAISNQKRASATFYVRERRALRGRDVTRVRQSIPSTKPLSIGEGDLLSRSQAKVLLREPLLSPRLCRRRQKRFCSRRFCFPGLPQGAKPLHVLADRDGLSLDIRHGPRAFFRGQTLPVGARDAPGRGVS